MKHTNELERRLADYFNWNKSRLNCFSLMLPSLLSAGTVNLRKIAININSKTEIDSRYRRLQRFFAEHELDMNEIAIFIFNLFFTEDKKIYLTVDRTNWYFGKSKINILTLGIAYEGLAIPIFWKLLDKAGNATGIEHCDIVKQFTKVFGKDHIEGVLADREFANSTFFRHLTEAKIPFYIRIKEGSLVKFFHEKPFTVKNIFKRLQAKKQTSYIQPMMVHGQKLFVSAGRSEGGELMIVATNHKENNQDNSAVSKYLRRWEIENLFQSLKGRGFNLEETHLTKPERIEKLMALVSIGFCWAHKIGEWRALKKPIFLKRFNNGQLRAQYSYFRYGLDFLQDIIGKLDNKAKLFVNSVKLLFEPPVTMENMFLEMVL